LENRGTKRIKKQKGKKEENWYEGTLKIPLRGEKVVEKVDGERDPSYFSKASVIVLTKGWSKLASTWTRVSKLETLKCFRGSKNPARCARTNMFLVTIAGKGWGRTILFFSFSNSLGRLRLIRLNARARAFFSFSTAAFFLLHFFSKSVLFRLEAIIEVYESCTNPKKLTKLLFFLPFTTNIQTLKFFALQQTYNLITSLSFTTNLKTYASYALHNNLNTKTLDLVLTTNTHLINQCTKKMKILRN
jgi:hypothetical protein